MNIHAARRVLLSLLMVTAAPSAFAGNSADVKITATVLADCTVSVDKSALPLGNIAVSQLRDKEGNDSLSGMTGTVTVTSTCDGASKAKLTVSTQTVADEHIVASSPSGASEDIMRFGLKINDTDAKFDDKQSVVKEINDKSLSTDGHKDTLTFSALAGKNASQATAGTYSATVTVKVEPE